VIGGYQVMLRGTALCSMRSELSNWISFGLETSRSYSTWHHNKHAKYQRQYYNNKKE